jgi:hypothetical protein
MSSRRTSGATPRPFGRSRTTLAAAVLAAAALFLLGASTVGGHEGGPRLILEPSQLNPGGVVLIRGEDLGLDEPMQVSLVGDAGQAGLAAVVTDGQGHFTVAVTLPADVPVGTYAVQAVTASGSTVKSLVKLAGAPIIEQGGAPPGQDEGFPALPAASGAQVAASAAPVAAPAVPIASSGAALRPLADPTGSGSDIDLVPFVALAGAIAGLGLLVARTRRSATAPAGRGELS